MSTALFHATTKVLELQKPIPALIRTVTEVQARIDRAFDQLCPTAAILRSSALFAGDDPAFCAAYLVSEAKTATEAIQIYRVEMPSPIQHPMYLTSHARFFLEDKETLAKIIQEYWTPTQSWRCWEYPDVFMTPVKIESTPHSNNIAGAKYRYGRDRDLAQCLWPKPEQPDNHIAPDGR